MYLQRAVKPAKLVHSLLIILSTSAIIMNSNEAILILLHRIAFTATANPSITAA